MNGFLNAFKNHPETTVFGLLIALCQALAMFPQFKEYDYAFQAGTVIFTALLGVYAATPSSGSD